LLVEAQKAAAEAAPAVAPPAGSESQAGTPGEAAPVAQESMPATAQAEAAPPAVTPAVEESVAAPAPAEPATPATPANEAPFAAAPAPAEPTGPALESAVGFQPAGSAEAPASQPSSLLGSLAGNPSVFWGGLAGLVALAGGLMSVRRRRPVEAGPAPAVADEETESVFARTTTEQTDPGRIHGASKASAASFLEPAVTVSTAEDPMAEVDVYLAYERFDQAEDLVRKAIAEYPDRDHYRLKLLEVHRGARNVQAFERDAASLRAAVGETSPLMDKARVWWSEMVPGRALLVAASAGGMAAAAAEPSVVEPGLERTLVLTPDVLKQLGASELPSVTHPAVALADDRIEVPSGDLDFDLGPAVPGDESTSESLSFDLDLGAPAGADESASVDLAQAEGEAGGGALDFELTLSPNEQAAVGPAQPSPAEPMSFDLDLAASAAGGASGAGDDTLAGTADFDLDLAPVAGGAAATPGAPAVSPGMDFTLDLAGSVRGTEGGLVEAGAAGDLGDPALASAFAEATQALDLDFATGALSVPAAAAMESLDLEPVSALSPDLADEAEGAPSQDFDLEEPLSFAAGFSADIDTIPIPNRSSPRADALLEDSAFNLEPGQTLAAAAASSLASGAQAPGAPEVAEGVEVPDLDLGPELQEMALADQPEAAGGVPEEVLVTLAAGAAAPTVAEAGFDAVEERAFAEGIDFELDAGFGETDAGVDEASLFLEGDAFPGLDEIGTKLDLARAYIDMGDTVGARGILSEVLNEGTDEQRGEAEDLLARLAS
jgi:pilus assembly protein FimV